MSIERTLLYFAITTDNLHKVSQMEKFHVILIDDDPEKVEFFKVLFEAFAEENVQFFATISI